MPTVSSLVKDMGVLLASQGLGTVGTDLFEGRMPSSPANAVTLYEQRGKKPIRTSALTIPAERPGLQVTVRNADYETGYQTAFAIRKFLQGFKGVANGVTYLDITATTAIIGWGADETKLYSFSVNFDVMRVPQ